MEEQNIITDVKINADGVMLKILTPGGTMLLKLSPEANGLVRRGDKVRIEVDTLTNLESDQPFQIIGRSETIA